MRFIRQSLTGLFLLSVTFGLLAYAGYTVYASVQEKMNREARIPQARERIFAVNVLRAVPQSVTPVLQVFGEVESRRSLELRAATGGRVIELDAGFVEGGQVRAGQVLVRIDPADAEAALMKVQADLQDAEAEIRDAARALELARDDLDAARAQAELRERALQRQTDLNTRGVGSAALVESAELAAASAAASVLSKRQSLATAEARVDQAKTRLDRAGIAVSDAKRALDDTTIVAGFDGTLGSVSVVEGRLVSANEKLAELIDGEALEVAFRVSTAQYARLLDEAGRLVDAPVEVRLDSFGIDLVADGQLSRDSAFVEAGQTGRVIYAELSNARGFKPGDFVTVAVDEPRLDQVIRLPASALAADGSVLVLGEDDRLEAVSVSLIRRQGDDILVRSRDLAGREVVAQRSPLLGSGIKVRPLRPDASEQPDEPELLELSEERRAKLVAFVEANQRMPKDVKTRLLAQLKESKVPANMVARLEGRMGG